MEEEGDVETVSPPDSWSSKDREVFSRLPNEAQEVIARRDREANNYLTQKSKEIAEYKRELEGYISHYQGFDQVLSQIRSDYGDSPDPQYLNNLIRGDKALQSRNMDTKVNAAWKVLESVGLHPEDLLSQDGPEGGYEYDDGLRDEVKTLREQNQQLQQSFQDQQAAATNREAQQFAFEQNEDGEYLRPFLHDPLLRDSLLQTMAPRIQMIQQANPSARLGDVYQKAYEEAIWTIPQIREQLVSTPQKQAKNNGIKAAKKKAAEAKKMSSSIKSSSSKSIPKQEPDSIRESLEQAWDDAS